MDPLAEPKTVDTRPDIHWERIHCAILHTQDKTTIHAGVILDILPSLLLPAEP